MILYLGIALGVLVSASPSQAIGEFRGSAALSYARHAVTFGERPSGSEQIGQLRQWIVAELKPLGGQLSEDHFTAETPAGPVPMVNLILELPGTSGKAIVISGHYDTKRIPMVHFVGANDGASSTGFLIEMARALSKQKHRDDIYIVFFDGEEAVGNWSETDSRYGSRHLVQKWTADGTLAKIKALINIDMIGDKDLDVADDTNSSQSLNSLMWQTADKLGDGKSFLRQGGGIDDDHVPFANEGVNVLDVIDFDYGPNNSYWHTAQDTTDKLSAHSFQVIGDVVLAMVKELEDQS
jgi:Zn-dependent M28 family amino/carboxypeptidase